MRLEEPKPDQACSAFDAWQNDQSISAKPGGSQQIASE